MLAWLSVLNPYSVFLSARVFTFIGGRSGQERQVPVTEYNHREVTQTTSAYVSIAGRSGTPNFKGGRAGMPRNRRKAGVEEQK